MKSNSIIGLTNVVTLDYFSVFPEYFVSLSIIYVLIVVVLITYNVYGLMLQKALSECIALILAMTCYLILNDDLITLNTVSFSSTIINDYLAFISKFLVCFFSSLYFLIISDSLKEQKLTSFEYLLIILFSILGLMLMCCSNDFLTAYLAIELSSLSLYMLAAFKKTSISSVESGIKYFIIGSISSAFFLLGSSFIYGLSGVTAISDFMDIQMLQYPSNRDPFVYRYCAEEEFFYMWVPYALILEYREDPFADIFRFYVRWHERFMQSSAVLELSFAEIGLTFIVFSLLIKLAVAPFHLWSLDVYEGSPTSSTFFFAAISKLSIFILLIRFVYNELWSLNEWQYYVLWLGVFSVFIGSFGGLKQRKIKTLLAYSSITNMGYGLLAFGSKTDLGMKLLFFHLIIYTLSGLCIWFILFLLRLKTKIITSKYNKELGDFVLLRKSNPALAFAFALTLFSIAGIPPIIGFLSKMGVFLAVMQKKICFFALISGVFSVIATFYYIRIIKVLYFENLIVGKLYYPIKSHKTILLSFLVFSHIFLFINPTLLYLWGWKIYSSLPMNGWDFYESVPLY